MSRRGRLAGYGACGLLVAAGIVCAVTVNGTTGQVLALVLIALGLVLGTSLVFLEVGLSEDRERAREEARRRPPRPPEEGRPRTRLERMRGRPRRLR